MCQGLTVSKKRACARTQQLESERLGCTHQTRGIRCVCGEVGMGMLPVGNGLRPPPTSLAVTVCALGIEALDAPMRRCEEGRRARASERERTSGRCGLSCLPMHASACVAAQAQRQQEKTQARTRICGRTSPGTERARAAHRGPRGPQRRSAPTARRAAPPAPRAAAPPAAPWPSAWCFVLAARECVSVLALSMRWVDGRPRRRWAGHPGRRRREGWEARSRGTRLRVPVPAQELKNSEKQPTMQENYAWRM